MQEPDMPAPPATPDSSPLAETHLPAAGTGLPGSEANKPGGGPQTVEGAPGAPRRKGQPDDGWEDTGTSYGGLRTRVSPLPPEGDDSPTGAPERAA